MKREVSFFKDHRASGGKALLEALRALGMTDAQIKRALIEYQKTVNTSEATSETHVMENEDERN